MPRRLGLALVLALTGALVLAPTGAMAKKKKPKSPPVTVVSNTQSIAGDNQQATVTATCPAGKIAVGGGVNAPASFTGNTENGIFVVYESRRAGTNAWQASVVRDDPSSPGPLLPVTASVDCRTPKLKSKKKKKKKLKVTEVSAVGSAGPSGTSLPQATATATCPAKTQALGGGFSSSPTPDLGPSGAFPFFFSNYRNSPTSWLSALVNVGTSARNLTSYAYCAAGLKIAETNGTVTLPGSTGSTLGENTATSPACTKGRALLGGGFNTPAASMTGSAALLEGSRAGSGSWQVTAFEFSSNAGTLTSFGYCA